MTEEAKTTGQDVATTKTGEMVLAPEQLALLQKHTGKQKFMVNELTIPQLKIVQTTSGYMKKSDPDYIKEAEEGQFIDTLTLQRRDPPISIIIVRFTTNYFENKPKMGPLVKMWGSDPSGYDAAAGGDVGVRITKDGNEIRGVGSYHTLLLNPDMSSLPCMMYLGSTAWKEARRLNTLLGSFELMGEDGPFVAPPYARSYTVTTAPMSDGKNTWMTWRFGMGPLTQTLKFGNAIFQKCVDFEESIDKGRVKVHGPVEDDREMGRAGQGSMRQEQDRGPPPDNAPPPGGEEDYGMGDLGGAKAGDQKKVPF